jgi:hypothetical protein
MTKQFLIVSSINYSTPNWIYVVLSRVTTLDGLFLMHPIKPNFNPQPTKLLQEEWVFQRNLEKDTLLHLQKFGNFPASIDVCNIVSTFTTNVMERRVDIEKKYHFPKNLQKMHVPFKFKCYMHVICMHRVATGRVPVTRHLLACLCPVYRTRAK